MHNARRRGKGQSRILYWFRTPPGVRVGRSAIDEDAIRLLEEHNPDVQFDWTHILKATPALSLPPAEAPRDAVPPRGVRRKERRGALGEERRAFPRADQRGPAPLELAAARARAEEAASAADGTPALEARVEEPAFDHAEQVVSETTTAVAAEALDDEPLIESGADDEAAAEFGPEDRTSAAFQRLGSEGLARLRARYAEVMARIAERPMDEPAREELKTRAERLNPDGWVTADEVRDALEQYEGVFEALRAQVGTRRRRRRRKRGEGPRADTT